jgi:hypothetical protein
MAENNAVTKDELKEILAEMTKDLRAETAARFEESERKTAARFKELEQKTAARFEESERKTAARFEESERKTAARFEESERKTAARFDKTDEVIAMVYNELRKMMQDQTAMTRAQSNMIIAQNQKIDDQYRYFQESHSRLLTGMDAMMKEHEKIRLDHLSLGAIQNRHTREIEAIQLHLGIVGKNDPNGKNSGKKKPLTRQRRKKSN